MADLNSSLSDDGVAPDDPGPSCAPGTADDRTASTSADALAASSCSSGPAGPTHFVTVKASDSPGFGLAKEAEDAPSTSSTSTSASDRPHTRDSGAPDSLDADLVTVRGGTSGSSNPHADQDPTVCVKCGAGATTATAVVDDDVDTPELPADRLVLVVRIISKTNTSSHVKVWTQDFENPTSLFAPPSLKVSIGDWLLWPRDGSPPRSCLQVPAKTFVENKGQDITVESLVAVVDGECVSPLLGRVRVWSGLQLASCALYRIQCRYVGYDAKASAFAARYGTNWVASLTTPRDREGGQVVDAAALVAAQLDFAKAGIVTSSFTQQLGADPLRRYYCSDNQWTQFGSPSRLAALTAQLQSQISLARFARGTYTQLPIYDGVDMSQIDRVLKHAGTAIVILRLFGTVRNFQKILDVLKQFVMEGGRIATAAACCSNAVESSQLVSIHGLKLASHEQCRSAGVPERLIAPGKCSLLCFIPSLIKRAIESEAFNMSGEYASALASRRRASAAAAAEGQEDGLPHEHDLFPLLCAMQDDIGQVCTSCGTRTVGRHGLRCRVGDLHDSAGPHAVCGYCSVKLQASLRFVTPFELTCLVSSCGARMSLGSLLTHLSKRTAALGPRILEALRRDALESWREEYEAMVWSSEVLPNLYALPKLPAPCARCGSSYHRFDTQGTKYKLLITAYIKCRSGHYFCMLCASLMRTLTGNFFVERHGLHPCPAGRCNEFADGRALRVLANRYFPDLSDELARTLQIQTSLWSEAAARSRDAAILQAALYLNADEAAAAARRRGADDRAWRDDDDDDDDDDEGGRPIEGGEGGEMDPEEADPDRPPNPNAPRQGDERIQPFPEDEDE